MTALTRLTRQSFIDALSSNDNPDLLRSETPALQATLQREIELLREMLTGKDAVIADLRERLDREGEERRKLTAILTNQREKPIITPPPEPAPPPATARKARRWWRF